MTLTQVNEELIQTKQIADTILVLRGQKVILDRELGREMLGTNRALAQQFDELEKHVGAHHKEIAAIIEAIRQLMVPAETPRREIGFHARETALPYLARRRR